jgi:IclR helix-turn-helix domain
MSEQATDAITITLSPAQIDSVVRAAARGRAPSVSALISESFSARGRTNGRGAGARRAQSRRASGERANGATRGEVATNIGRDLARGYLPGDTEDPRLSRSLLRGLSLLTGFGPDGGERGIVELADELGMSPSTAHRYALTLVELGLLERCPRSRKYRLPDLA